MSSSLPLTQLVETPENRAPAGGVVEVVKTSDGFNLRTARWAATNRSTKGTICIFNGRSEFIEKYFEVVRDFRARGFSVATFDWRGQGGSQRLTRNPRRGHIERFEQYHRDVDAFMRGTVFSDCPPPYYALAHSMGAAVLFDLLSDRPLWFERMVASGPMVALPNVPAGGRLLAKLLAAIGLKRVITPGYGLAPVAFTPFAGNPVSTDPKRYAVTGATVRAEPLLGLGGPTIGWVDEAFGVMDRLADANYGLRWRTPTLIVAAGMDRVVSTEAAENFGKRLRATRTIVIPGAQHEMLMERDEIRDRFMAAFDAYIPGSSE